MIKDTYETSKSSEKASIERQFFPYKTKQYCLQKDIRETLQCHPEHGISLSKKDGSVVVIRNAHKQGSKQRNIYQDRYDPVKKAYRYIGKGLTGNQSLSGANSLLKYAAYNKRKIHLFWQDYPNNYHQYLGEVKVIETIPSRQIGKDGLPRDVYEFLLRPIENSIDENRT